MQYLFRIKFPVAVYIVGIVILGLALAASQSFNIPIRHLLADPAQTTGSEFYVGFMSNLTVITWAIGAYVALYTWSILARSGGEAEWIRFFKLGGFLMLILMLDDLFMFHESIFPDYLFLPWLTGLNPNEKFVLGAYGIFTIYYFVSCKKTFLKTPWWHFVIAIGILAFGLVADRGIGKYLFPNKTARILIEDGSKFLGVLGWSCYYLQLSRTIILSRMTSSADSEATE